MEDTFNDQANGHIREPNWLTKNTYDDVFLILVNLGSIVVISPCTFKHQNDHSPKTKINKTFSNKIKESYLF